MIIVEKNVKVHLLSDIHLEFADYTITNKHNADALILSGDVLIANEFHRSKRSPNRDHTLTNQFNRFLQSCSDQYADVFYVAGNHEFYNGDWYTSLEDLSDVCAKYPNVHFLEQDLIEIDDFVFIGGTLWTDLNKRDPLTMHNITNIMNDFNLIRNDQCGYRKLSAMDTIERHAETVEYFKRVIYNIRTNKTKQKVIVITHHGPSAKSVADEYKDDVITNSAYYSDLSNFILDHEEIILWTAGHTHHAYQYKIGNTLVVCNPRGYQDPNSREYTGWDPDLVLDLNAL